jgi:hypothetical protein
MKRIVVYGIALTMLLLGVVGCRGKSNSGEDAEVKSIGTVEVTARLLEVPEGAIFYRELYNYATILKYEVVSVHRGALQKGEVIYVGHRNPWMSRTTKINDKRMGGMGGNLKQFQAKRLHRMALETPMDDHYMGGIVDKYFGKHEGPSYFSIWTNQAD